MGFLSRLRAGSSAGSRSLMIPANSQNSSQNVSPSFPGSSAFIDLPPPMEKLTRWSTTINDSATPSPQVKSFAHFMRPSKSSFKQASSRRQSMDRSTSIYIETSPAESRDVLTESKWQSPQPSSPAVDRGRRAYAQLHHMDSSITLYASTPEVVYDDDPRRSLDTRRSGCTRSAVASNKRLSRLQSVPSMMRPFSPKKGTRAVGLVQQGAVGLLINKSKSSGLTTDTLVATDTEGGAAFTRIIDLLCPPPVGYTPDAFEERVDLIKGLVNTALAKKGMKLSAESIFQTLEGKMDRRLKTILDAELITEPEIQSTRISLAFALARHLCGASPLTSHLRLYAAAQEQTNTAVFYPGIGAITSISDIVAGAEATGAKAASRADSVHILYPPTPTTPLSLQRSRLKDDPRRSLEMSRELSRNTLTTIGRPPPLRPSRTGKRPGTANVLSNSETPGDTTAFKSVDRLSVPRKATSGRSRPRTAGSSDPSSPDGRSLRSERSMWGSLNVSTGHSPRLKASEGDHFTYGSGLAGSQIFVTADTSMMQTSEV